MVKSKSPKKKKAKTKKKTVKKKGLGLDAMLLAEAAVDITAGDCAAYAVMQFNNGNAPGEWQQLGLEAYKKFLIFGWAAYHAFDGLSVDWEQVSEQIIKKVKALPKK